MLRWIPALVTFLAAAQEGVVPTFGTTVVMPYGLRGDIYLLRPGTERLPKFEKLESVGSIYTASLNVPPRDFSLGFPGVTNRFEWFAIDYNGKFWIDTPGTYRFLLTSDDGSKLYIDGRKVIDNDGTHPAQTEEGQIKLSGGSHRIRVSYFQGPRFHVALVLLVAGPDDLDWKVFSTDDFRPPVNPADWKYGGPGDLAPVENPKAGRRKLEPGTSPIAPIRALHAMAPGGDGVPLTTRFIREALPNEGVNVLVLEFDYRYRFTRHPEVAEKDALSREDVKALVEAARSASVTLIPEINLLGHQSSEAMTLGLLRAHPEFDETPGLYPGNQGIYSRSYCPLHPQVHEVVFDLIDELAEACEADSFHVGLNEVFLLGEAGCPRCANHNKAGLFAGEVRALHDHLALSQRTMWMWGDRLLDGSANGIGDREGSTNGAFPAIRDVPRDIVICDWHYDTAFPTAALFAREGFRVLSCPWRKPDVALKQLAMIRTARSGAHSAAEAARFAGMMQTTWMNLAQLAEAYFGDPAQAGDAVKCFRELFRKLRAQ